MKTAVALWALAVAVRVVPHLHPPLVHALRGRVEASSPFTDVSRHIATVREGWFLASRLGTHVYEGGTVYHPPILLATLGPLLGHAAWAYTLLLVAVDVACALLVGAIAGGGLGGVGALAFALNPFAITSCVAGSSAGLNALAVLAAVYFACGRGPRGRSPSRCGVALALATYASVYPLSLCVPLGAAFGAGSQRWTFAAALAATTAALAACSYALAADGSWAFLWQVYGKMLTAHVLTPNTGLWWYLFTEMFDHWRGFFVCVFNLNVFTYVAPLTVRFKDDLLFAVTIQIMLVSMLKSAPAHGDAALALALLPLQRRLFKYLANPFLVASLYSFCAVLFYVFHDMWLVQRSGNANFYFAISMLWGLAQALLVTDLIRAKVRAEVDDADPRMAGRAVATVYMKS